MNYPNDYTLLNMLVCDAHPFDLNIHKFLVVFLLDIVLPVRVMVYLTKKLLIFLSTISRKMVMDGTVDL